MEHWNLHVGRGVLTGPRGRTEASYIVTDWVSQVKEEIKKEKCLPLVQKNFTILSPKLVLAYAEDILSDSKLKSHAKFNAEWCKSVSV